MSGGSVDFDALYAAARAVVGEFACSQDCAAGSVAAALVTEAGTVHTGVCIDTACSLGFCAEHAAIADMLKNRLTRISGIVAVAADGAVMPPCGRCRELIRQVDPANWNSRALVAEGVTATIAELMPHGEPSLPAA